MFLIHDAKGSREQIWAAQEDFGEGPVWEFHVYGLCRNGDARTVPSLRMACDLLGVDPAPIREACQPLVPTEIVEGREARVHRMPPGPDRAMERSRTYAGIAAAMADQWAQAPSVSTAA